ncbi:D-cysteine desulfhydrase [Myxococcaceae bacterium]|nr:D-cysteine desulfhydrase [Myxococcaceae bacterium]
MADAGLPLFRAHPILARHLPRQPFLESATPVEPLPLAGAAPGALYVKRDDRSCPLYGGNKPRKLEFVIGRALARGSRLLVTTGGLGTNHGLATTILGRSVGLRTALVLVDQPATETVRETLRLQCAYGAEQIAARNVAGAAAVVAALLARATLRGDRPTLVPTGGSSALGDVGFVSAAFELAEQIRAGALPEPQTIVVPIGSGGSVAGLVLGLRLAGLESRVLGVLVTDILPPSPARLARAARATLALLRGADPSIPAARFGARDFPVVRDQLGAGYGAPTPAALEAVREAASLGIRLETTYTGKALAEIRARIDRGALGAGPTLFWNTYNGIDVAKAAPGNIGETALPAAIRRALSRCTV